MTLVVEDRHTIMTYTINVTLIEDDETIRDSYAYLIGGMEGYSVISTYASYEEAAKRLHIDAPDVILLDIELPGINGIDALLKIKKILPNTPVVMLTVYENEHTIFEALVNGANGYLTKDASPQKMVDAIKEVMEGGGAMSANVARLVIKSFHRNQNSPLTRRETEILEQISLGKSRKRIAEEMYIDMETVKSHIKNIYLKLDVHSKADAIKMAKDKRFI